MHWLPLVCGMTENRDEHKLFADLEALTDDQNTGRPCGWRLE
jgi:hypothetical protein